MGETFRQFSEDPAVFSLVAHIGNGVEDLRNAS